MQAITNEQEISNGLTVAKQINIRQAQSAEDITTIASLFKAYTDSLGIDLTFQYYASELASLPGAYGPPKGALLLALDTDATPLGCMGVRSLPHDNKDNKICEAKRLYVTPKGRGKGTGTALIQAGMAAAKAAGYEEMKLDTLLNMSSAQSLYRRFGFVETAPYYNSPIAGTVYMSCDLVGTGVSGEPK